MEPSVAPSVMNSWTTKNILEFDRIANVLKRHSIVYQRSLNKSFVVRQNCT